jgi:hypothetical protein
MPKPVPWYILNPDRLYLKALDAICEALSLPSAMLYLFFIAFGFCESPEYIWNFLHIVEVFYGT